VWVVKLYNQICKGNKYVTTLHVTNAEASEPGHCCLLRALLLLLLAPERFHHQNRSSTLPLSSLAS
jgi:hypothetical protein